MKRNKGGGRGVERAKIDFGGKVSKDGGYRFEASVCGKRGGERGFV